MTQEALRHGTWVSPSLQDLVSSPHHYVVNTLGMGLFFAALAYTLKGV
jgi:hypothetical protein